MCLQSHRNHTFVMETKPVSTQLNGIAAGAIHKRPVHYISGVLGQGDANVLESTY